MTSEKTKISNPQEMEYEENALLQNGTMGINIDTLYLTSPEKYTKAKQLRILQQVSLPMYDDTINDIINRQIKNKLQQMPNLTEEEQQLKTEKLREQITPKKIRMAAKTELSKPQKLADKLAAIPDGCAFRINPFPPDAMLTLDTPYADEYTLKINSTSANELKQIKEKSGTTDITIVVSPYSKQKGIHIPKDEEKTKYIDMCDTIIKQTGCDKQNGKGLILELGNEMNIYQGTKPNMNGNEGFARKPINPIEYANWYYDTVTELKKKYPDIKCSITGTAFFDEKFLNDVVSQLEKKPNGKDTIDIISFHPYRSKTNEATATIKDGETQDRIKTTYDYQINTMQDIATKIGDHCQVTVGEISYYQPNESQKSIDFEQLKKESMIAAHNKIPTYIWPAASMIAPDSEKQEPDKKTQQLKIESKEKDTHADPQFS